MPPDPKHWPELRHYLDVRFKGSDKYTRALFQAHDRLHISEHERIEHRMEVLNDAAERADTAINERDRNFVRFDVYDGAIKDMTTRQEASRKEMLGQIQLIAAGQSEMKIAAATRARVVNGLIVGVGLLVSVATVVAIIITSRH